MTKQNYFKLRNKDKNLRYKFLKNENQILVKKVVNDCNILSSTKARRFYTKYFRNSKNLPTLFSCHTDRNAATCLPRYLHKKHIIIKKYKIKNMTGSNISTK